MENFGDLINDNLSLNEAFKRIISEYEHSNYTEEIAECISNNNLQFDDVLTKYEIKDIADKKEEMLDLILQFFNIVLDDFMLTSYELAIANILKKKFKIVEGDFFNFKKDEIQVIISKQLQRIYRDDDRISDNEALYKVELQGLFDLGYDQFLKFANIEDKAALSRNANILELDTFLPPEFNDADDDGSVRHIPQDIKDKVWKRDEGKCAKCGSQERLEFDHIIPFSKGGSSTYRNVQLLCEKCNRKKLAKIGLI